jgi:murein DD-endopeptidase MepM/ murein hydrolase activator NlpD
MASKFGWGKIAVVIYLFFVHLLAFLFVLDQINSRKNRGPIPTAMPGTDSAALHALRPDSGLRQAAGPAPDYSHISADTGRLMIPVAGVKSKDLMDTYTQSRSGGRVHNAIDIMAAEGTPVVAVADGEIAKFFDSHQGGITIYQWSANKSHVYYYAHLQRRADGISEGQTVKRGTVLGYVGHTGNAGEGNDHLHFAITIPKSPDRHWEGEEVNPYPVLKEGIEIPAAR